MPTYTDAERFLQGLFPDWQNRAFFAHTPGGVWTETRKLENLDATSDCYVSTGAFNPACAHRRDGAQEVVFLAVDDVGSNPFSSRVSEAEVEKALGPPTDATQTSPGNQQWFYALSAPVAVGEWGAFARGVEKRIGAKLDTGYTDPVHVYRLPMGMNTKPEHGGFAVHAVAARHNPKVVLDVSMIERVGPALTGPAVVGDGADIKLGLDELREFMGWIKNDISDRQVWVTIVGHGLKALCRDDEDGFTVFDEWSDPEKVAGYNRKTWVGLGVGGLLSKAGKLKALAQAANPDGFAKMFAPLVFDDGAVPPEGPRQVTFALGANNQILSTMENAARALWGLGRECRYDEFHHRFYVGEERLTDHMVLLLRVEINSIYGKDFGDKNVLDAITALGLKNKFNPVCEMLRDAEKGWDGVRRLDRLGPDYFHTEDSVLARACFRKTMLAAVRRARRPGVKFDQILVLESPEGWDKSTAWAVLAGEENFSDASILGKDARAVQEELADVWIHEIADLSGLARAEVELVKAFASRTNDRARPAYGKVLLDQPRQSIEVGTTNSDSYLMAQTGNRRFWPFELQSPVDTAALRADRAQLWGEAAAAESAGETLVLDRALWDDAAAAQEERRVVDPWEDELANLPDGLIKDVSGVETITNVAIHDYLGGHRGGQLTGAAGRKINEIMKRHGWKKVWLKDAVGKRVRGYSRGTDIFRSVPASDPKNVF